MNSTNRYSDKIHTGLSVTLIAVGALLLAILLKYYSTIAFVHRNTLTHLSKLLFINLFLTVLNLVYDII